MSDTVPRSPTPAFWPGLASGLIVGAMAVVMAASFAALVFNGPLAVYLPHGLAFALLAGAASTLLIAAFSSLPGTVGGTQSLPVAILAGTAASVAGALDAGTRAPADSVLPTVAAALAASTLLTALVLWLLGRCGAGRLARFIPYPVLGGVLAGSAWLLGKGAFGIMAGPAGGADPLHWLPGLLAALLMLLLHQRWSHPLVLLAMVGAGVTAFHAVAWASGHDGARLAAAGWLLPAPGAAERGGPLFLAVDLRAVDWAVLAQAGASLATLPVVTAIALLLNVAALESAARAPLDINRELRAAGLANAAAALLGGLPGYQQLALSAMNRRAGATTRWVGVWAAALCVAALLASPLALGWLPRPVLGALLLFVALLMLRDWVVATWGRLSALDHAIVIGMVMVTALAGLLAAVVVGLAAAVLLFTLHYGRIDPVRQVLHGDRYGSRVTRPARQAARLQALGGAVCILQLQGFLFFGIADRLLLRAHQRLLDAALPPLRTLVLDCRRVTGCDSSAAQSFARLHELLEDHGVALLVTHAPTSVLAHLDAAGLDERRCRRFVDLDHGLEWCETQLLAGLGTRADDGQRLHDALAEALGGAAVAEAFLAGLPRLALRRGQGLIEQDEHADQLYLLESGVLSARRVRSEGPPVRLQVLRSGGLVVGEVGFYAGQPRTAAVVADEDSVVYRLGAEEMRRLAQEQPALAAAVHRWLATLLARRVAHLVGVLDSLEN